MQSKINGTSLSESLQHLYSHTIVIVTLHFSSKTSRISTCLTWGPSMSWVPYINSYYVKVLRGWLWQRQKFFWKTSAGRCLSFQGCGSSASKCPSVVLGKVHWRRWTSSTVPGDVLTRRASREREMVAARGQAVQETSLQKVQARYRLKTVKGVC